MDLEFRVKVHSKGYLDPQTTHHDVRDAIDSCFPFMDGDEVVISAAPTNPAPLTPDVHIRPQAGEPDNIG